jgi:hypothetical protein
MKLSLILSLKLQQLKVLEECHRPVCHSSVLHSKIAMKQQQKPQGRVLQHVALRPEAGCAGY